ncbi:hypothetical protein [Actinokineospora sp.]|uniref:hypothetical protein n=1 Tax=Actinokineospora sp. TaxID=1872133 RepID=UPI004037F3FB
MGTGQEAEDRYVTGGVNWDSYSLEALVAMVADNASAPQLERLADDWRAAGKEVTDAAQVLALALEDLMHYWSGVAAEQARADVARNAQWVADLGETAHEIGNPVEEAAGALKAAQDAMPEVPAEPAAPPALAVDSAERGLAAGGPLASAINGTAAGAESAFAARQEQTQLKARAVEAMKRFEGAAMTIDRTTPQFTERDAQPRPREDVAPPRLPTPGDWLDSLASYTSDLETRWTALTGGEPGTTAQGHDEAVRSGAGGGYTSGGGYPAGGGADSASRGPLGPGVATGVNDAVTARPAGIPGGALAAAAGAAGAAGAGMGMGGMPMGGGGQGNEEHRRRFPFDGEDPFALDQKASPPVIGL